MSHEAFQKIKVASFWGQSVYLLKISHHVQMLPVAQ